MSIYVRVKMKKREIDNLKYERRNQRAERDGRRNKQRQEERAPVAEMEYETRKL